MVNAGKDAEEPVAQQHVAHFRINGEDLTRLIRERLLEDAPGHAWRIASCLGNQDAKDRSSGVADAALKILQGKAKLVGDEKCMEVVDEPVAPGDYILNHVGYAIRRIPTEEIAATLALYEELLRHAAEEDLMAADVRGEIDGAGDDR